MNRKKNLEIAVENGSKIREFIGDKRYIEMMNKWLEEFRKSHNRKEYDNNLYMRMETNYLCKKIRKKYKSICNYSINDQELM